MFKTIADPADCEVCSVIRFLNAKNVKPAEIHRQRVEIYGENVMTDGMVRKWVRQFKYGRTNVHDEARSGRPSVVNDGLVAKVNEKIRENSRFTIRMLCDEFPQISKTVLNCVASCHKSLKLSQFMFPLGSDNAYGCPQNEATWQCFHISYPIQ
ncbi:hypothetical protein AVEN_72357-1 [Araneus ventricosus]|uniref:Mos1 transposase HTH domain-containing protein n=1 Tax=Araneus ventricosus TaxID=182803 RepID=A0A4Y2SLS7_ARAVE|nr:hypothetical protein AVEN_72357-1 [Araneus ventricosus]